MTLSTNMDFMTTSLIERRVQRVRHELKARPVQVARVERLGADIARITFTGEALADFTSLSFDDHVKFILPAAGVDAEPTRRDYTPRRFDRERRELLIDFVLHADGPAGAWALQATPGQSVVIGGPRGSMVIPTDYDWHLLVGDASALPAIGRRLEELPASARVHVIAHAAEPMAWASAAAVEVQWVRRPEALVSATRALVLPDGIGFAWAAGEAGVMAQMRQVLLEEKQLPRACVKVAAYWKRGAADFHETLAVDAAG